MTLAREKTRYGYRRLHVLLLRTGMIANHKRVWRVYHEAGLSVKRRKRKRLVRVGRPLELVSAPNQEWALDFASDRLATGRSLRVLSVIDAFTRECIALEVDTSFASRRVTRVLEAALGNVPRLNASDATMGRNSPRDTSWLGALKDTSTSGIFSQVARCKTGMWKVSTVSCATSV